MFTADLCTCQISAGSLATTQFTTTFKSGGRGRKRESLQLEPLLVSGLKTIKKVACGDMFTACLTGTCVGVRGHVTRWCGV